MTISKQGHYLAGNGTPVASFWLGPPFLFVHARACPLIIGSRTFGTLACHLIQAELYRTKRLPLGEHAVPGGSGLSTAHISVETFANSLTVAAN